MSVLEAVEVKTLNLSHWISGSSLGTNLWIVDNKHFYFGPADLDWKSHSQVR